MKDQNISMFSKKVLYEIFFAALWFTHTLVGALFKHLCYSKLVRYLGLALLLKKAIIKERESTTLLKKIRRRKFYFTQILI